MKSKPSPSAMRGRRFLTVSALLVGICLVSAQASGQGASQKIAKDLQIATGYTNVIEMLWIDGDCAARTVSALLISRVISTRCRK
jgi:hypothetical protein